MLNLGGLVRTHVVVPFVIAAITVALTACTSGNSKAKQITHPEMAYILNDHAGTVTPIQIPAGTVRRSIKVDGDPVGLAASPDGDSIYVFSSSFNSSGSFNPGIVTCINVSSNKADAPIRIPGTPNSIIFTPNGEKAYVASIGASGVGNVTPINVRTGKPGDPIPAGFDPTALAITPDGSTVYVVDTGKFPQKGRVTPIHTATNTPGRAITVCVDADAMAVTPDGTTAYVDCIGGGKGAPADVIPIRTASNIIGHPIQSGSVDSVAISPNGKIAYALGNLNIIPINTNSNKIGTPISTPGTPLSAAFSADGKTGYFLIQGTTASVTFVRTPTNKLEKSVNLGSEADGMALAPDGKSLYVIEPETSSVIPVSASTGIVGSPILINNAPDAIAIAP